MESREIEHVTNDPVMDVVSFPLKIGHILTTSATATISTLFEELVR